MVLPRLIKKLTRPHRTGSNTAADAGATARSAGLAESKLTAWMPSIPRQVVMHIRRQPDHDAYRHLVDETLQLRRILVVNDALNALASAEMSWVELSTANALFAHASQLAPGTGAAAEPLQRQGVRPHSTHADHAARDLIGVTGSVSQHASSIRNDTTLLAAAKIAMLAFRKSKQGAVSMPDGTTTMSTMRTSHHPIDRLAARPHHARRQNTIQRSIKLMARRNIPPLP